MAVVTVAFEDLNTWLQNQPDNTVDTSYELNITGLIASDIGASTASGTLGNIIRNNSTKYVDLRSTSLPSGITEINSLFLDCVALVYSPSIPTSVTSFSKAFQNSSLKLVPTLHEGITVLKWAFENTLITVCPELPSTVTDISSMCYKCYNLVTPPSVIPESVTHMNLTFAYCSLIVNPPLFPSNVFYVEKTYRGCTSLAYKPIIPSYMSTTATATYLDVPTKNWKGTEIQVRNFIKTNECQSLTGYFEIQNADNNDLIHCTDLDNYSNLIGHLPDGTTCYILYVGITANNVGLLKTATIYYSYCSSDLSYTVIPDNIFSGSDLDELFYHTGGLVASPILPEGITSLKKTFYDCQSLIKAPVIPSTVTDLTSTFELCCYLSDPPLIPSGVTTMVSTFSECYRLCSETGVAPTLPNTVTNIQSCFYNCNNIIEIPELPNSITNMDYAFSMSVNWTGSTQLQKITNIPSSVTRLQGTFVNCISLETPPTIPNTVTELIRTFKGCTSLKYIPELPSGVTNLTSAFEGCTSIANRINGKTVAGVAIYHSTWTDRETIPTIGSINKEWSSSVENAINGNDFTHNEYIGCELSTDVTVDRVIYNLTQGGTQRIAPIYIVKALSNNKLYVVSQEDYYQSLVKFFPVETIGLDDFSIHTDYYGDTFYTDSSKTTRIPSEYFYASSGGLYPTAIMPIGYTFYVSDVDTFEVLVNDAVFKTTLGIDYTAVKDFSIPSSVTKASSAFSGCSKIERITEFQIPLNTLKNNTNFQNMFQGCTSLSEIGYKISESNWHVWRLKFGADTVEGKVFFDENTSVNIPQTSITKSDLNLPVLTVELWFPEEADVDVDLLITKMLSNKYGVFKKTVLPPDQKNFVLWADNPANVKSNLKGMNPVDVVQSGNMNPVTSNAVADKISSLDVSSVGGSGKYISAISETDGKISATATDLGNMVPVNTVTSGNMQSVTSNAVSLSQSYFTDVEIKTGEKFTTASTEYDVYTKQFRMLSSSYTDNNNRRMFEFNFTLPSNTNIFIDSSGYILINTPSNISVYRRRWDMRSVVVSTSFQITFATAVHYSKDTHSVNVRVYFDKTVYAVTGIDGYIRLKYIK